MKAQKSEIGLCNSKCLELVDNEQDAHDADMESVTLLLTANDVLAYDVSIKEKEKRMTYIP